MNSRAVRLTLFVLFVALIAGATYVVWSEESQGRAASTAARALNERVEAVSRLILEVKSSQAGYVAAGQGEDFWAARVDTLLASVRDGVAALRAQSRLPTAQREIDTAGRALADFEQMDRRARDYARSGQRLLASDLVFSDGLEKVDTALGSLVRARDLEVAAADRAGRDRRRAQIAALAGAALLGLFITFVLVPVPMGPERAAPQPLEPARPALPAAPDAAMPVAAMEIRPELAAPKATAAVPPPAAPPAQPATPAPPEPQSAPTVDLAGIAALCTDLSRVADTRALPAALERAAALLDASGLVIWIADPDGRELAPIVSHGYPDHLLVRMGTIGRDAENVTAAAFRTGLVQTVSADAVSNGAVAAPLIAASGPVGVMAAELHRDPGGNDDVRAIAAIVAAQLATLMGPPSRKAEAARA